jgi:small subunit ribosomal protein S8
MDNIADMLTKIRNAGMAKHNRIDIPSSKMKLNIIKILKREGYIKNYKILKDDNKRFLRIILKFDEEEPVIKGLKRISKQSRRVYVGKDEIPRVMNDLGIAIISTSKGLMTNIKARNEGIGGEVICYIW